MYHPPAILQGTLWSMSVDQLDITTNRIYIIHQVLAYGTLDDLKWLFRAYPRETIRDVFLQAPIKIYTRAAFHFAKLILKIQDDTAPIFNYDKSTPRHIG